MNVWQVLLIGILCVSTFIVVLAILYNLMMVWFAGCFSGKTLKKHLLEIENELPGKDCGDCGCETCKDYAYAVFTCHMDPNCCTEGGPELAEKLNAHMDEFLKVLADKKEMNQKASLWDRIFPRPKG